MNSETITVLTQHDQAHFRAVAQLRKAKKLAAALRLFNVTSNDVELLSDEAKRLAERAAGVDSRGISSDTTWAMVSELLAD